MDTMNFVKGGLIALHRLIALDLDESPEGDAIRDSLDGPMLRLTPEELLEAQAFSEALYREREGRSDGSNCKPPPSIG